MRRRKSEIAERTSSVDDEGVDWPRITAASTSEREAQTVQRVREMSSDPDGFGVNEVWETEKAVGADSRKVERRRGCSWRYSC
jgi:hypothetical protein